MIAPVKKRKDINASIMGDDGGIDIKTTVGASGGVRLSSVSIPGLAKLFTPRRTWVYAVERGARPGLIACC